MLSLNRFVNNLPIQFLRRVALSSRVRANVEAAAAASASPQGSSGSETSPSAASTDAAEADSASSKRTRNPLVAAAFESLKDDSNAPTKTSNRFKTPEGKFSNSNIDERIINAKTVNGLLSVSEGTTSISREHALKIVSILAEWSTLNRVKIADFENDARFLRICRVLGRTVTKGNNNNSATESNGSNSKKSSRISGFRTDDLNTVLGVAGDDEAAKLIASISLPQMVRVMSTLASRKRRSTPLLRSLAFNISSSTETLDLKQCADVLYAMASLNFQDSVLAAKLCGDIQAGLPKNTEKSAVVGSILTSLGILRYRDLDILEALTQWTVKYSEICRPQDLSAYFLTASILNFKSSNLEEVRKKLVKSLVREDFPKPLDWLNHVWALALLGLVENAQLDSVLKAGFAKELESAKSGLSPTSKMKLLNLNSYAQLMADGYTGALIATESNIYKVPMAHAKPKQILLNGMLDALKSFLPSSNHVMSSIDSKMGFLIDALCLFDDKRNPLPVDKEQPNAIKVALMVIDFHDLCHGPHRSVSGITHLCFDLLEKSGHKVIPVPYNEFNTSDKLLKRVQYLEKRFKMVVSPSAQ